MLKRVGPTPVSRSVRVEAEVPVETTKVLPGPEDVFQKAPSPHSAAAVESPPKIDLQLGNRPIQPSDVTMIGDSQLVSAQKFLSEEKPGLSIHAQWGQPIQYFRALLNPDNMSVEAVKLRGSIQTRSVLSIHLGGNNISNGDDGAKTISEMKGLIEDVRKINPDVRIAVADIPWRFHALEKPPDWLKKQMEANGNTPIERQTELEKVNRWISTLGDSEVTFSRIPINRWVGDRDRGLARETGFTPEAVGRRRSDRHNVIDERFQKPQPDVHLNERGYQKAAQAILKRLFVDTRRVPRFERG